MPVYQEDYWTYRAGFPTPTLDEAISVGAISPDTTETDWHKLTRHATRNRAMRNRKGDSGLCRLHAQVGVATVMLDRKLWHKSLTADVIMEACERHATTLENPGFCLTCGNEASGVEPDARNYECKACGEEQVFGAEELLLVIA